MKISKKLPFIQIAITTFVVAALLVVAVGPRVLAWRDKQVNALIAKSKTASSQAQREEYLRETMTLGWGGVEAPSALADYYVSLGRYDKAWRVLQNWPLPKNYTQLGSYALQAQEYTPAQRFYARAISQKATAEAYVGLAAALFNKNDTKNGCANAAKASKLDLNSQPAQQIAAVCLLLNKGETTLQAGNFPILASTQLQTERGIGNFLIANRVYVVGEKRLLASPDKTPADWLVLAQLASARGDYKLTIERGERGISLDRTNPGLNKLLFETYSVLGQSKADFYKTRYESLPLDK